MDYVLEARASSLDRSGASSVTASAWCSVKRRGLRPESDGPAASTGVGEERDACTCGGRTRRTKPLFCVPPRAVTRATKCRNHAAPRVRAQRGAPVRSLCDTRDSLPPPLRRTPERRPFCGDSATARALRFPPRAAAARVSSRGCMALQMSVAVASAALSRPRAPPPPQRSGAGLRAPPHSRRVSLRPCAAQPPGGGGGGGGGDFTRRAFDAVGAWLVAHPAPLWLVTGSW